MAYVIWPLIRPPGDRIACAREWHTGYLGFEQTAALGIVLAKEYKISQTVG